MSARQPAIFSAGLGCLVSEGIRVNYGQSGFQSRESSAAVATLISDASYLSPAEQSADLALDFDKFMIGTRPAL